MILVGIAVVVEMVAAGSMAVAFVAAVDRLMVAAGDSPTAGMTVAPADYSIVQ